MFRRIAKVAGAPSLADYTVGQHVQTTEGFPGVIDDILEGPADLTTYWVTLDNQMGGGEYSEGEIWPLNQNTAAQITEAVVEHTAGEDYPELSTILSDRLPPQITTVAVSKTGKAYYLDTPESNRLCEMSGDLLGQANRAMTVIDIPDDWGYDEVHAHLRSAEAGARSAAAIPPLSDRAILQQFEQYPKEATFSGIKYFKGEINDEWHVDCLLCYRSGQLIGVLNHYPQDMGPERKGNVLVMVHPDFRRQGIGAALWAEAKKRWNVKGAGQDQTPSGSSFLKGVGASADATAARLALYLPPVPPGGSEPSSEEVDPAQQSGYDEGFSQGKDGTTRSPSQPGDPEFMIGFGLGWAKGVTVLREPANSWDVDDLLDQQVAGPDSSSMSQVMTSLEDREAGGVINWVKGKPDGWTPGRTHSYDWCRFRKDSHCYLPKTMNEAASKEAGYAVWNPEDRGYCPRTSWDSQKICPTGEPGPNADNGFTDATTSWEDGGQRGGVPSDLYRQPPTASVDLGLPAMPKHADRSISEEWSLEAEAGLDVEATWADVRNKAKRIRSEGGVRIVASKDNVIVAHVKGDHGVYETELVRFPGKDNIANYACGCKWASYSWGRSGRWKKFEGRVCAHALALQYEAQARNMFGRELTVDEKQPSWMDGKHVHTPNSYSKDKQRYTHLASTTPTFRARVRGLIKNLLIDPAGDVQDADTGENIVPGQVLYPGYHPTLGLNPDDNTGRIL